MGIFNTQNIVAESSVLDEIQVEASAFNADMSGALNIVAESEANYNEIMKAIGINELTYFEENGEEIVYEGAKADKFFGPIINFFTGLYEKLKSLFTKFIQILDQKVKSDKSFVTKYEAALKEVDTKGFEFKGFQYVPEKIEISRSLDASEKVVVSYGYDKSKINADADLNTAKSLAEGMDSNTDEMYAKVRGAIITGSAKEMSQEEFSDAVFKAMQNGEKEPVLISDVKASEYLDIIKDYKEDKKMMETDLKKIEKSIRSIIKDLKTVQDKMKKGENATRDSRQYMINYMSKVITVQKNMLNFITAVNGGKMQILKRRRSQAKAVCVALVSYSPKAESTDKKFI